MSNGQSWMSNIFRRSNELDISWRGPMMRKRHLPNIVLREILLAQKPTSFPSTKHTIAYAIWRVALTVLLSARDTHVANVWRWATLNFACFAVCLFACNPAGAASFSVFATENTPARIAVLGRFYIRWPSLALFVEQWLVLMALEASTDGDYKVTHGGQRNTSLWCNQVQRVRYLENVKLC